MEISPSQKIDGHNMDSTVELCIWGYFHQSKRLMEIEMIAVPIFSFKTLLESNNQENNSIT